MACLLVLTTFIALYLVHSILFDSEWNQTQMGPVHGDGPHISSGTAVTIADIEALRTLTISRKCDNPFRTGKPNEFRTLNVSEMPMNYVPFLNRCSINKTVFASNHAEWLEMFINSEIGYIHNYKVAGTTIMESFHTLAKSKKLRGEFVLNQSGDIIRWNRRFLRQSQYFQHREEWYSMMTDIFLFSLVRDPIDRLLSAFYEVNTREVNLFEVYGIANERGIDKFRKLLTAFWNSTKQHLLDDDTTGIQVKSLWSAEAHFHPQSLVKQKQK